MFGVAYLIHVELGGNGCYSKVVSKKAMAVPTAKMYYMVVLSKFENTSAYLSFRLMHGTSKREDNKRFQ